MNDNSEQPEQKRFGLSASERDDVQRLVRYAATIGAAVAVTLLIVMLVSSFLTR